MKILIALLVTSASLMAQPAWENFSIPSKASLRGVAAVSSQVCWVSGSNGSVFRTVNEGASWSDVSPSGYADLQFRDIQAFGTDSALVISAGLPAVILRTTDGGKEWLEVYRNETEGVFFDALDFWNSKHGIAFSNAIENKLLIITTRDGGLRWTEMDQQKLPFVGTKQGGFAASGTCLVTFGKSSVIIGLGGVEATILLSHNRGHTWHKTQAPLDYGETSRGIFGFHFIDTLHGFCVGGDYRADSLSTVTVSETFDGGHSWEVITDPEISGHYRSAVTSVDGEKIIAVSRTGCSYSDDRGKSWKACDGKFYSLSKAKDGAVWASGPEGSVARLYFLD